MKKIKAKEPTIAVVGHLVKDEIITPNGTLKESLGGIAYSLTALGSLLKRGKIFPICKIGRDIENLVRADFGGYPKIDFSGAKITAWPTVVNRLVYAADGNREESNSRIAAPLKLNGIDNEIDAVLLNFISGKDVKLPDLKNFKNNYKGLIYCDYHSLSLGYDKKKRRYYRLHPRFKEYIGLVDIVQMNMAELASIYRMPLFDTSAIARACRRLHETGVEAAIVTAGAEGVFLSNSENGHFYHIPAIRIRHEVDPTGCGDTLGAAFLYRFLQTGELVKSLEIANLYAAAKVTFSGLRGFEKLGAIVDSIGSPVKAVALYKSETEYCN